MSILSVPLTIRSTQRIGQIALTLTRHGFGHFVRRLNLKAYLPIPGKFKLATRPTLAATEANLGKRLVKVCEELGPTFIKLGQMLSSRPDLLPPGIIEEFRKLQDHVEPFDTETAKQIIERDLENPTNKLFGEFADQPFASGSIAQAYMATATDGQRIVVKVKRPNIEHTVKLDMHILRWLAANIERHMPEFAVYDPSTVVEEFHQTINHEMDLLREAAITNKFSQFFADDPHIVVPSVRWELTGSDVLTITYLAGRPFHEALADKQIHLDRRTIAWHLLDAMLRQYLELGLYHADPHPGNILILGPSQVGLLDFGMVGQLDRARRMQLVSLLVAVNSRELDIAVDMLAEMGALQLDTDTVVLRRDLTSLLDKYDSLPIGRIDLQKLFVEITNLARINHVKLPRDFIMVAKSLVTVGGAALDLDRNLNLGNVIRPRIRKMLAERASPQNVSRQLAMSLWHTGRLLRDTPSQLRQLTRKMLRGQLSFQVHHPQMDFLVRELDRSSNRMSFSMIVAAIIIGSSLVFHAKLGPTWYDMPILGLTGYLVAGIMGLWLVIAIIRSGKLS